MVWIAQVPSRMMGDDVLNYFRRPPQQPMPTDALVQLIRNRDWEGTRRRAVSHPWDAQYRAFSESGSTPLHLTCLYQAPVDVVRKVLDAHPSAIVATDTEGWTPLHVAFLYGVHDKASLLLIRRGGAVAAAMQSFLVGSPLHVACRHRVSTRVLRELIKTNPAMVRVANKSGAKPAKILWMEFAKDPANERIVQELGTKSSRIDASDPNIVSFVKRIQLLLNAATGRDIMDSTLSISIHEMMALQSKLGLSLVIPLAVQLCSKQLSAIDNNGNLPLHIAASTPVSWNEPKYVLFRNEIDTIDVLVQHHPSAARIANGDGRLPLHLSLEQGKRTWNSGVGSLIKAAPQSVTTRDVKTHMYPVQLAAAQTSGEDDKESLETIYNLLLAWPAVLQHVRTDVYRRSTVN